MKMHDYLISYTFSAEGCLTFSNGMSYISRVKKINNIEEAESARKFIESGISGAKNLAINNIVYLGRNKHEV